MVESNSAYAHQNFGAAGFLAMPSKKVGRGSTAAFSPPPWTANSSKAWTKRTMMSARSAMMTPARHASTSASR